MEPKVASKKEGHLFSIIINRTGKMNRIDAETEDLLVEARGPATRSVRRR